MTTWPKCGRDYAADCAGKVTDVAVRYPPGNMRLLARKRDGSIHDRDDVLQTPGQRICGLELSTREDVAERISTTEWNVHAVSERKTILQDSRNPIGIGGLQVWGFHVNDHIHHVDFVKFLPE